MLCAILAQLLWDILGVYALGRSNRWRWFHNARAIEEMCSSRCCLVIRWYSGRYHSSCSFRGCIFKVIYLMIVIIIIVVQCWLHMMRWTHSCVYYWFWLLSWSFTMSHWGVGGRYYKFVGRESGCLDFTSLNMSWFFGSLKHTISGSVGVLEQLFGDIFQVILASSTALFDLGRLLRYVFLRKAWSLVALKIQTKIFRWNICNV